MNNYRKEYFRERRRIQSWLRRANKRGFEVSYKLPSIPKTITSASIRRLSKITPDYLYNKSVWVSSEGEIFEGQKAKQEQRKEIRKKTSQKVTTEKQVKNIPSITDIVLSNIEEQISSWQAHSNWTPGLLQAKEADRNTARSILQGAISQLGREQVAINLNNSALEVNNLIQEILYASGSKEGNFKDGRTQVNENLVRFRNICYGTNSMTQQEAIDLSEAMEYNELY